MARHTLVRFGFIGADEARCAGLGRPAA
jgi:hypothetical protein